jgi:hypothetical protein
LVFRNNETNRRPAGTSRNSSKFVKISTFLIPHSISSVCFGCFDTGPKHRNKPKKTFLVSRKSKLKQIEFRFVSVPTEKKKNNGFEDPLLENVFWRFFRFVSRKFCLFRLFRYRSETPKQTEKNVFWFREANRKTTETD